jgi:hypothetical protein
MMQPIFVYAISYVSFVALLLGWRLSQRLGTQVRKRAWSLFLKWMIYTVTTRRWSSSTDMSILAFFVILILYLSNIVGSILAVQDRTQFSLRLARLCMTNLVALYLGVRGNVIIDRAFRLSYSEYHLLHRWIGRLTVVEGLIHGILRFTQYKFSTNPKDLAVSVPIPV